MRVLLTGSSGWLGRYLGPALRLAGHAVTGLDVARDVETHVVGSVADRALNLLEAAVAAGHDRFVFTSTTSLMIHA